jgi:aquaporin Z
VGTAFLVIVTRLTTRADVEQRYLALAMTLSALIYAFDHVSGAHFNPAVTLGMVASRRVRPVTGALYVLCQTLGGIAGGLFSHAVASQTDFINVLPSPSGAGWAVEFLYTFALILVQQNAGVEKNGQEPNSYFGIAVAFTVLAGACATFPISGGCFNPAVGTGVEFASLFNTGAQPTGSLANLWLYWSAPLSGALVATAVKWYQNLASHRRAEDLPTVVPLTECVGTFFIVLTASLTSQPLAVGAMLMGMVYMGDHVCGADFNPAVTLGVALRFGTPAAEWWKVAVTVMAQFVGAVGAAFAAYGIKGTVSLPVNPSQATDGLYGMVGYEALWTGLIVYVACAVMTPTSGEEEPGRERAGHSRSYQGLALGFVVAGGIYGGSDSGGAGSGGVFNPALGSGIMLVQSTLGGGDASTLWVYWVGPLLGALGGSTLFSLLHFHTDPFPQEEYEEPASFY